ncbi:Mitotic spindle assembly checkpoint protein MAD2A [Frankliniella fusca]|uniref:Mitotic spindle assembly checkpoint protein MAD2A n=1 Tax=Frankliniella fusca TaxID=407009 RepID=A0AAE1HRL3_9NEOP|nr:Mitotic spindle assembly checkpoint protein MAD2A [Frankliniella fusca]
MTDTQLKAKNNITLKGSAEIVMEYLNYGINSILFQRGVYPPETFKTVENFGLSIFVSTDEKIISFVDTVLKQMKDWLLEEKVQKISMIITNISTKEALERWDFNVKYEAASGETADIQQLKDTKVARNGKIDASKVGSKELKVIQNEIRDVLRQICSTVSFLPLLDCLCAFDIHIYTNNDCEVPNDWNETAPCIIANSQELQLRTFSTSLHHMATVVSYKAD